MHKQYAFLVQPFAGKNHKPLANILREGWGALDIEAQLNCRGDFIDVLAAGTRRMDETEVDLAFWDVDEAANLDHLG